jgi:hypothetical protein
MAPRQPLSGLLIVRKGWPQRAWRAGGSMEKPITADFTYWIGCVQRFGPHIGGGECLVDLEPGPVEGARLARAARRPRTARCTVATPIARPDQRTGHTPRHAFSFRFPHVGRTHDTALRS